MDKTKAIFIAVFTALSAWMGILAIPVYILVAMNLADYITGIMAAPYREDRVSSSKGLRGIAKKICMWLLVALGAAVDQLLMVTTKTVGITLPFSFAVAALVAVWLIANEIISILENIADIGVETPPFLEKIVSLIMSRAEETGEKVAEQAITMATVSEVVSETKEDINNG